MNSALYTQLRTELDPKKVAALLNENKFVRLAVHPDTHRFTSSEILTDRSIVCREKYERNMASLFGNSEDFENLIVLYRMKERPDFDLAKIFSQYGKTFHQINPPVYSKKLILEFGRPEFDSSLEIPLDKKKPEIVDGFFGAVELISDLLAKANGVFVFGVWENTCVSSVGSQVDRIAQMMGKWRPFAVVNPSFCLHQDDHEYKLFPSNSVEPDSATK
ncbi:MAG: hypothetical protein NT051_02545 [Candidatus Micrarchaeota archaeon]|nr:hypothetical protein [Candidatus Micrarchaeota archaeon]